MTGKIAEVNIIPNYIKDMENRFGKIGEGVKVVVDSANATGGVVGPESVSYTHLEAIINNHKIEVENSNLISSSKFIKTYKRGSC